MLVVGIGIAQANGQSEGCIYQKPRPHCDVTSLRYLIIHFMPYRIRISIGDFNILISIFVYFLILLFSIFFFYVLLQSEGVPFPLPISNFFLQNCSFYNNFLMQIQLFFSLHFFFSQNFINFSTFVFPLSFSIISFHKLMSSIPHMISSRVQYMI